MAQPIYHLWLMKPTEAWYQLSKEEQEGLLAKAGEALVKVGGKEIVSCGSRWASEQWAYWGVEQYPDLEAVQKHDELLNEFNWFRYGESMTVLGTAMLAS